MKRTRMHGWDDVWTELQNHGFTSSGQGATEAQEAVAKAVQILQDSGPFSVKMLDALQNLIFYIHLKVKDDDEGPEIQPSGAIISSMATKAWREEKKAREGVSARVKHAANGAKTALGFPTLCGNFVLVRRLALNPTCEKCVDMMAERARRGRPA